ncbi:unnamed protein product [Triticum turgidum subsp. durum]|uniref:Uncharacterized protein n=1 Tax=Triticum turgidum subsp. durum TaxID=4567 RepID=A0A9R0TCD0_TRITD|nr:unnamed protein product [Triticum turgidum subsp. durum]
MAAPSAPPCRHRHQLGALPMQDQRPGALLHAEAPHRHLLQERVGLRLGEVAYVHRHEPGRGEHCPPWQQLVAGGRGLVPPDHAALDLWLDQEALDLARDVGLGAHGVQGLEQERAGLECLEQVRRERQLAAVTTAVHRDDKLGAEPPDQVKDRWHRGGVNRADGKVHGDGVAAGNCEELRGVDGVEVEHDELEGHPELGGEVGEVLVDELQLQRVVRRRQHQCGHLERGAGAALRQLLHQRRPLLADADVEVEHVDAAGAAELVEHGLHAGEVRELEHRGELGEGLVGAEL